MWWGCRESFEADIDDTVYAFPELGEFVGMLPRFEARLAADSVAARGSMVENGAFEAQVGWRR